MQRKRRWTLRASPAKSPRRARKASASAKTACPNSSTPRSARRSAARLPERSSAEIRPAARSS
eukprot:3620140-Lingulodinium_polyedra.AAC.1